MELTSDSSKLTLCLKGKSIFTFNFERIFITIGVGLKPNVQLSFDTSNAFSMGCVLAKDRIEKAFQVSLNTV